MDCFKVNRVYNGDIDDWGAVITRNLIVSILNIIDLILTIISFNSNCLTFFVLKYINITITFMMFFSCCYSYSYSPDGKSKDYTYILLSAVVAFIALGLEIAVLVYFIKSFSDLNLIAVIAYFIHWLCVPLSIFIAKTHDFWL